VVKQIKKVQKKLWSFAVIKRKIIDKFHENSSVLGECACINTRRIFYLSIIAIPLRIIGISQFAFKKSYDTPVLKMWNWPIF
jgi:hypothetical protein